MAISEQKEAGMFSAITIGWYLRIYQMVKIVKNIEGNVMPKKMARNYKLKLQEACKKKWRQMVDKEYCHLQHQYRSIECTNDHKKQE